MIKREYYTLTIKKLHIVPHSSAQMRPSLKVMLFNIKSVYKYIVRKLAYKISLVKSSKVIKKSHHNPIGNEKYPS